MKKKKIIAIVAAVCVIAVIAAILLPGISSDDQGPTAPVIGPDTGEYISRAEWIEQLGLCFTLNTYDQTAPYYSDVPAMHGVFAYVQSCYEWGILRDQQAFEPDQTATRAFVAETAMLALALERNPSIAEKDATELLQLACDEGILADQNTYGVTAEECENIIRKLKEVYFDYQPEEYANITLKDSVVDYSAAEITWRDETVLVVPADVGEKLYVGAIFLAPGEENGIARKVVSVTTANGKTEVETVTPDIEEVFEELSFSFFGVPTLESIVPLQEGITISPLDEATPVNTAATDAQLVNLSNATPLAMGSKKDPISFSVKVNLTKGSIKPNFGFTDYFSTEASKEYKKLFGQEIPKNAGDIFKKTHTILKYDKNGKPILEKTEEWKGGYEITGELKVKKLYVESTCAKDLNSFSNELHFIVDSSLTIKGELKGSLPVYETKIRGPYGVQIKVVFSVYVDMNGKLTVGAEVEHVTNVTYKNKKFKTTQDTDYEVHADLGADISSGVKGEATVSVLGIDLVDVSAKAGASLDIKATAHQSENTAMICIDGKCYFPIVSVSVGSNSKTVAGKLGIKTTIKLVDKSGALSKSASATLWHYEISGAGSKNVKKCTWGTNTNQGGDNSKPGQNNTQSTDPAVDPSLPIDGDETSPSTPANPSLELNAGDHILYGKKNGTDLSWEVLEVNGTTALLFCDNVIDDKGFGYTSTYTYHSSPLSSWCAEFYLSECFTEDERSAILPCTVDSVSGQHFFILSLEEFEHYYPTAEGRARPVFTGETCLQGAFNSDWRDVTEHVEGDTVAYWLRSTTYGPYHVDCSSFEPEHRSSGADTRYYISCYGICPAFYLDISKVTDLKVSTAEPEIDHTSDYILEANLGATQLFENIGLEDATITVTGSVNHNVRADWIVLASDGTVKSHGNYAYICYLQDVEYTLAPGEKMIVALHTDTCKNGENIFQYGPSITVSTITKEPITRYKLEKNKNYSIANTTEDVQTFYLSGNINHGTFASANIRIDCVREDGESNVLGTAYNAYATYLNDERFELNPQERYIFKIQSDYTSKEYIVLFTLNYGHSSNIRISESNISPIRTLMLEIGRTYSLINTTQIEQPLYFTGSNVKANFTVFNDGQEGSSYQNKYLSYMNPQKYVLHGKQEWLITPLSGAIKEDCIVIFMPYTVDETKLICILPSDNVQKDDSNDDPDINGNKVTVPNVVGMEQVAAVYLLRDMGLQFQVWWHIGNDQSSTLYIVEQSIPAGTIVEKGTLIRLQISKNAP